MNSGLNHRLVIWKKGDSGYMLIVKVTENGKEFFIPSFGRLSEDKKNLAKKIVGLIKSGAKK